MQRRNILVVYAAYPTRANLQDGLTAFRRYSRDRVFYLNVRMRSVPRYVADFHWDLIIFHSLFFSARADAAAFRRLMERVAPLAAVDCQKVSLSQDEYINADLINEFILDFGVQTIFSVQPEREWPTIYAPVQARGVKVHLALTGYLDERRVARIESIKARNPERPIDIGYRTGGHPLAWWGRHGYAKLEIAHAVLARAAQTSLNTDISFRYEDTLFGDRWYSFLCRCKYQLGVESGTSINDHDGSIKACTEAYAAAHPNASFKEIEAACFPGVDGKFKGFMISPRHLEASAAETCQVLTKGEYSGMLRPGEHYIPLERDWSNLDEVLDTIRRDDVRNEMVQRTYADIVASGKYTYRSFVELVIERTIGRPSEIAAPRRQAGAPVLYNWMKAIAKMDAGMARLYGDVVMPIRQRASR